jgi:hypothetical protein
VPEERCDDGRAQRRTEPLVEMVFQCERALPRGGVGGIERRRGTTSSAAMMCVESPIARPSRNKIGSVPRPVARQARIR